MRKFFRMPKNDNEFEALIVFAGLLNANVQANGNSQPNVVKGLFLLKTKTKATINNKSTICIVLFFI